MRCENTDKYADYYLLLEECVKYYNEYQLLKQQKKIEKLETTLKDRVIPPSCKHKQETLTIVYLEEEPEYQYYGIRGQNAHVRKQLKRLNKTEEDVICSDRYP